MFILCWGLRLFWPVVYTWVVFTTLVALLGLVPQASLTEAFSKCLPRFFCNLRKKGAGEGGALLMREGSC
jgi:hypothetical protein